jgi:hypothetical protein
LTLTIGIVKLRLGSQDMLALPADQRKQGAFRAVDDRDNDSGSALTECGEAR